MTAEEARKELPNVLGSFMGEIYTCRTSGRLNTFATVSPWMTSKGKSIVGPCYKVAWETVARCSESNKPILLE